MAVRRDARYLGMDEAGSCRLMDAAFGCVRLNQITNPDWL